MTLVWLMACAGSDPAPAPTYEGGWHTAEPLLTPLQEHAVVVLDGQAVVIGGFEPPFNTTTRVEAYDPVSDSWSSLADLPDKVHHAQAAVVDGSVYLLGTLEGLTMSAVAVAWVLDPGAQSWAEITPLPAGFERGGGAAVALDGRIHVVGGLRGGEAVAEHHVYDPLDDSWQALASMDRVRDHLGAVALDGLVYAVGGRAGSIGSHTDSVASYDPVSDAWTELAPMPTSRGGLAVAVLDGLIYAFGGEGNDDAESGVFPQAQAYDPATDAWVELPDMPVPRHGLGAAAIDGRIFLPGGGDTESLGVVDTHEVYVPD